MNNYIAVDQYGQTFHGLKHPRKDLLERLGCSYADKMYQDKDNGDTVHTGYIIGGLWLSVYEVKPMERIQ